MREVEVDAYVTARIAIEDAVEHYLERKSTGDSDGSGAGAYAAKAELILGHWNRWLVAEHGVRDVSTVDADVLRAYAQTLRARADGGAYTASTAQTYFAVVRAFLSWCARNGLLERNPAATEYARAPLPARSASAEQPSTTKCASRQGRRALLAHVRERALEASNVERSERLDRLREYAIVSLLAYSGVRGSELFRVPEDDRRIGATWDDVDFYTGTIRVLGKSQRIEAVPLPAAARTPLRRYRVVQEPPTTDWPLFPTHHAPSTARHVRAALRGRGYDEAAIDAMLEASTAAAVARERAIAPPAITTEGARSILKRLCSDAGLDAESYVTPRGVRSSAVDVDRRPTGSIPDADLVSPSPDRSIVLVETYQRPFDPRPELTVDE